VRILAIILLCILTAADVSAATPGTDAFAGLSGELRIAGSDVGLVAAREAAEAVMAAHPGVRITFSLTGAGSGLRRVRLRQADICLYDRDPASASRAGAPLEFVAYGVDPVAVVVNPVNTVGGLSLEQAKQLFGAKIRFWNEVGGPSFPAMPLYIEASEEEGKPDTKPGNVSVSSQPAMRFTLARNKETLGYISMRDLDASLKPVAMEGVAPSLEAFRAGRYRIYRVMHAAVPQQCPPLAKAFLDFLAGPKGQEMLTRAGYLPLKDKPAWGSALAVDFPDRLADGQ
jgi:phosphate transport system substrate-binding protein